MTFLNCIPSRRYFVLQIYALKAILILLGLSTRTPLAGGHNGRTEVDRPNLITNKQLILVQA